MRFKPRFLVGGALIVAAVAYLIFTGIRNTAEYYLTVDEVHARESELKGQSLRVAGRVKPGTTQWDPVALRLSFSIVPIPQAQKAAPLTAVHATESNEFHVTCIGQPKPDMFADNRDVIVEGRLEDDSSISATQVLTSCPSKYQAKDGTGSASAANR